MSLKPSVPVSSVFLTAPVEQQIKMLEEAWPAYPYEDDDLDEYGMWFLVKAPVGVVWLTPDGGELWT